MAVDKNTTRTENINKIGENNTFEVSPTDIQEVNATMINDMVVGGVNVGSETEVFKGRNDGSESDGILEFRTLKAGTSITLSLDGDAILINAETGGLQDLQSVLNVGATATIDGMFSVTAGGSNLYILPNLLGYTYNVDDDSSSMSATGDSFGGAGSSADDNHAFTSSPTGITQDSLHSNGTATTTRIGENAGVKIESVNGGAYSKYNQGPQAIDIQSTDGSSVFQKIILQPIGDNPSIQIASKKGGPGLPEMSISGWLSEADGSNFKVSREYEPLDDATALWDIDGTLRVRDISVTTDSEYLVVDGDGIVSKRSIPGERNFLVLETGSAVNPDPNTLSGVGYTALASTININNPQGSSPSNLTELTYRLKDDGSAQTIAFGDIFRGIGVALPTTTTPNKTMYIKAIYNADEDTGASASGTWDVVSVYQEA